MTGLYATLLHGLSAILSIMVVVFWLLGLSFNSSAPSAGESQRSPDAASCGKKSSWK